MSLCVSSNGFSVWGREKIMSISCSSVGFVRALMSSCFRVLCPKVIILGVGKFNVLYSFKMMCLRAPNCGGEKHLKIGRSVNGGGDFLMVKYFCLSLYVTRLMALLIN